MAKPDESEKSPAPSPGMLFIVSSNVSKADPATRKLIRSHARRGKTRKRIQPSEDQRATNGGTVATRVQMARVKLEEFIESYVPLMPGRIGSNICFVEFADGIGASALLTLAQGSSLIFVYIELQLVVADSA